MRLIYFSVNPQIRNFLFFFLFSDCRTAAIGFYFWNIVHPEKGKTILNISGKSTSNWNFEHEKTALLFI